MVATLDTLDTRTILDIERPGSSADRSADDDAAALGGPYKVVLERLQRLVSYRRQMQRAMLLDPGDPRPASELVRIRQMVREVHRAVSINAEAKLLAQRIDPGE